MKLSAKKDIAIILIVSFVSAIFYIALEGKIMDYGRDLSNLKDWQLSFSCMVHW